MNRLISGTSEYGQFECFHLISDSIMILSIKQMNQNNHLEEKEDSSNKLQADNVAQMEHGEIEQPSFNRSRSENDGTTAGTAKCQFEFEILWGNKTFKDIMAAAQSQNMEMLENDVHAAFTLPVKNQAELFNRMSAGENRWEVTEDVNIGNKVWRRCSVSLAVLNSVPALLKSHTSSGNQDNGDGESANVRFFCHLKPASNLELDMYRVLEAFKQSALEVYLYDQTGQNVLFSWPPQVHDSKENLIVKLFGEDSIKAQDVCEKSITAPLSSMLFSAQKIEKTGKDYSTVVNSQLWKITDSLSDNWVFFFVTQKIRKRIEETNYNATDPKTDFLVRTSHEIRTPLNGIIGMLQYIRSTDLSDDQASSIDTAHISAISLLETLNDIVDMRKIEMGKLQIHNRDEPASKLRLLVKELVEIFAFRAYDKGLEITIEPIFQEELTVDSSLNCIVNCDLFRIRQILQNLMSNALKYTVEGQVKIAVWFSESNQSEETFTFPDGRISVSRTLNYYAKDSGIGIPQSQIKNMFAPFERIQSEVSFHDGAGLGLAISNQIAGLLGGVINVESQEGVGSKFTLSIPIKLIYPSLEKKNLDNLPPPVSTTFSRALYVGGKLPLGLNTDAYLEKHNSQMQYAGNVSEALEIISNSPVGYFQCIIFNDPSGCSSKDTEDIWITASKRVITTFKESLIKRKPECSDILIFLMVPFTRLTKSFLEGNWFNGWIAKPVLPSRLKTLVKSAVSKGPNSKNRELFHQNLNMGLIPSSSTSPTSPTSPTSSSSSTSSPTSSISTTTTTTSSSSSASASASSALGKRKREPSQSQLKPLVLVVEDNPVNQNVVCKLLSLLGVETHFAENGLVACELVKAQQKGTRPYSLILMDIQMPVLDGFLATETIRSYEAEFSCESVPIVALTANAMVDMRNKCISSGMNDVLSKPILLADLKRIIEKWA